MKETLLPRIMWISKSITLKQLHFQIFEYLRHTISEWIDWKDPQTKKVPKDSRNDMRKTLVDFPYRPDNWNGPFTKKDFLDMSLDEQFDLCMSGLYLDPSGENSSE
jgi:hypothetical protein